MLLLASSRNPGLRIQVFTRSCKCLRTRPRRLLHTTPPAAPLHPAPSYAPALANLTSDLDKLAPRFDTNARKIRIIKVPSDFYSVLKVHRTCWYRSTMPLGQLLRVVADIYSRKKSWMLNIVFFYQPSTLELLNTRLLVTPYSNSPMSDLLIVDLYRSKHYDRHCKTSLAWGSPCCVMLCGGPENPQEPHALPCLLHS